MAITFFVHVVESPSPSDMLDGRTQGRALCSFLDIACIPYVYSLAVDETQFEKALDERLKWGMNKFVDHMPILHFCAHGSESGIQLTGQTESGSFVAWKKLASLIKPLHDSLLDRGGAGVCMSSCSGGHGIKMAEVLNKRDLPFAWLVGSFRVVYPSDVALAFGIFYHAIQRNPSFGPLFEAIRVATGIKDFNLLHAGVVQEQYAQAELPKFKDAIQQIEAWCATEYHSSPSNDSQG